MQCVEHSIRARAARAKEEAAREDEVFAAERPLKPLRKLRPSALVQHVPVLLQAISHHRWPVRALAMELLAKCPADVLAPRHAFSGGPRNVCRTSSRPAVSSISRPWPATC